MAHMHQAGGDAVVILQDLLELVHWLTRLKLAPEAAVATGASELEQVRGGEMAKSLPLPVLGRCWQMLLKGINEARTAPSAIQAAEMVLVRIAHAAELPTPAEIVAALRRDGDPRRSADPPPAADAESPAPPPTAAVTAAPSAPSVTSTSGADGAATALALQPAPQETALDDAEAPPLRLESFEQMVRLFAEKREAVLYAHLMNDVHLVRFEPGHLEYRAGDNAPGDLANRLSRQLGQWTGEPWLVSVCSEAGAPTRRTVADAAADARRGAAISHPLVQAALETFPGATVEAVHDSGPRTEYSAEPEPSVQTEPSEGDDER
jgi:DNA polymerase-3 subunit gamma/tau